MALIFAEEEGETIMEFRDLVPFLYGEEVLRLKSRGEDA